MRGEPPRVPGLASFAGRAKPPSRDLALCDRDLGYLGWLFYHINGIDRAGKLRYAHALIRVLMFWYKMAELTASVKTSARKTREKGKGTQFCWDSEMAQNLITCFKVLRTKWSATTGISMTIDQLNTRVWDRKYQSYTRNPSWLAYQDWKILV